LSTSLILIILFYIQVPNVALPSAYLHLHCTYHEHRYVIDRPAI